MSRSALPAWRG